VIIPYEPNKLFEVGNFKVEKSGDVLIVDNWYKNYEDIFDLLQNTPVPIWKKEVGRNFVDYYDCRPILNFNFLDVEKMNCVMMLRNLIKKHFIITSELKMVNRVFEFNYFKHIKFGVSSNLQHHPHVDHTFNALVYLDKVCSGGTAIYDYFCGDNNEHLNLLFDVSNHSKTLIEAKPNRLVVFNGLRPHGGFISDHDEYVDSWRINQVMFFD